MFLEILKLKVSHAYKRDCTRERYYEKIERLLRFFKNLVDLKALHCIPLRYNLIFERNVLKTKYFNSVFNVTQFTVVMSIDDFMSVL